MKAIVIGCNGYIGQNLCLFLFSKNVELRGYDVQSECALDSMQLFYHQLDITNENACVEINWNVDIIYFFAGLTGTKASIDNAGLFISTNENGLNNVLKSIVSQNVRPKFIFPSTRLVYKGMTGKLNEESLKEYKTVYALNKFSGEQLLEIYSNYYGLSYAVFRLSIPYGNLGNKMFSYGTIGNMINQAKLGSVNLYGDGNFRRTFTHIGYIVEVLYDSCFSDEIKNDIFNIGGENYSLREVAVFIAEQLEVNINFVDWPNQDLLLESGDTVFDSNKLDSILKIKYSYQLKNWINSISNKTK